MVWHHSLLLMNSFNKTEAAVSSCRLCFLRADPFISLLYHHYIDIWCNTFLDMILTNSSLICEDGIQVQNIEVTFVGYTVICLYGISRHNPCYISLVVKYLQIENYHL